MLLNYQECIHQYGSDYGIRKAIANGSLYKIKKGIYSDQKYVSDLEVFTVQHPKAVFTMNSAFYYHGLTDTIPDCYYVKTTRGTAQIADNNVKQIFENSGEFDAGKEEMLYDGIKINIYNKERCFIELVRNRSKLPYDYYKELIHSYRNIIHQLDIQAIEEYAYVLPKTNMVLETLQTEVM
ncbi:hypothetical protein [uncultured Clostridium sp.]|uniref:type IV toxin-antitoxin system AbiEi family antitoxin domain-containing protein n=1 Tax=uncultured Clostridium sp. TaxID=59620 RepID=UPI0025DF8440|nr:hypothetical protein [uncultured Clostridium sp.]